MTPQRIKYRRLYEKWWLGKYCNIPTAMNDYKLVIGIELIGPPSFVCGVVYLHFEDGSQVPIFCNTYKPRKKDVKVQICQQ